MKTYCDKDPEPEKSPIFITADIYCNQDSFITHVEKVTHPPSDTNRNNVACNTVLAVDNPKGL